MTKDEEITALKDKVALLEAEVKRTTTNILEHIHYWQQKYTTIDGVDCFSGLECECGLYLPPDAIQDIINEHPNALKTELHAIPQQNNNQ